MSRLVNAFCDQVACALEGYTLHVDLQLGGLHFEIRVCAEGLDGVRKGVQNAR